MGVRAVFLDRDGIVNELIGPGFERGPRTLEEFQFKSEIFGLVSELSKLNFICIVITNQPDIARGKLSSKELSLMHEEILTSIPGIERIYTCPHDNSHNCSCRKPKPGLLLEAIRDFDIDASDSYFLGDRWTDISAAQSAGVSSVLLRNPKSDSAGSQGLRPQSVVADHEINSLMNLLSIISQ